MTIRKHDAQRLVLQVKFMARRCSSCGCCCSAQSLQSRLVTSTALLRELRLPFACCNASCTQREMA